MFTRSLDCVVLIGTVPPPFGGVSIHVKRLAQRLVKRGIKCYIISSVNSSQMINGVKIIHAKSKYAVLLHCIKLLSKRPIFHFHTMWNSGICKFVLKLMGQRIVSTIHDTMLLDKYEACSSRRRFLNKIVIHQKNEMYIAVNTQIQTILVNFGIASSCIFVIPAYLPENVMQTDKFPEVIKNYAQKYESLILVYGWRVSFDRNGLDIYGFKTALKVYATILQNTPKTGIVVLVPGGDSDKYIENIAVSLKLQDKYLLYTKPIENMRKLLLLTNIYFRPSSTDGDSVLIREALEQGVGVVASNVLQRPNGVVSVENKIDSYVEAIQLNINNSEGISLKVDFFSKIIEVYQLVRK